MRDIVVLIVGLRYVGSCYMHLREKCENNANGPSAFGTAIGTGSVRSMRHELQGTYRLCLSAFLSEWSWGKCAPFLAKERQTREPQLNKETPIPHCK